MKISSEFSKYAKHYGCYNVIQEKVIQKLINDIESKPKRILDLGCGSGALCSAINWDYKNFVGVDFAPGMLEIHPKSKKIEAIYGDFNGKNLFESLGTYKYDYIFSASALQWAINIEKVFENIKLLNAPFSLAIFTSGTFSTINDTAGLEPMLRDSDATIKAAEKYFNIKSEIVKYKLEFESTRDMFRYIKKSGVSGSRNVLKYSQTKKLMRDYPLNYLEFEVLFITSA